MRRLAGIVSTLLAATIVSPAAAAIEESQMWITEMATIRASKADLVTIDSSQRARSDAGSGGEQFRVMAPSGDQLDSQRRT